GLRQSLGLFLTPMERDLGITAANFGLAMAVQNLAWGISQPVTGMLADRYGSRVVALFAGPVYVLGLIFMALGGAVGLHIGGGVLVGLAVAGSAFGVVLGAVARSVPDDKRAIAVSIVSAAGSIGTMVLAPLGQHLINDHGWQSALLAFAVVATVISVCGLALENRSSEVSDPDQANPVAAVRQAFAHPGFCAMTVAFLACGFQLVFISTHLPSYLEICGIAPSVGATALGLIGVANAIGTLALGILGARFGNSNVLCLVYLLRTAAIAVYVLVPVSVESTLIFAAAMGLLWLGVAPLVSAIITSMFGSANFGVLFGVMFFSHQLGSFAGAWLGGVSFDVTGNYTMAWWGLVFIGVIAALLQALADDRPREMPA
ncbi:MAG: MFS transporter, partial [Pseudomonadota bacterium]